MGKLLLKIIHVYAQMEHIKIRILGIVKLMGVQVEDIGINHKKHVFALKDSFLMAPYV